MAKIIFDERYYYDCDNLEYFKSTIKFIKKYLDVETLLPYSEYTSNNTFNNMKIIIDGMIADIDNIEVVLIDTLMCPQYNHESLKSLNISENYLKLIGYYLSLQEDIIFISIENLDTNAIKKIDNIYIFNHIYKEFDSCFAEFVSENKYIKNIVNPTKSNPLPNFDLCKDYKERQDTLMIGKDVKSLQSLYYSIGREVIKRNKYKTNQHVSSLNPSVYGDIFSFDCSKTIYSSVDIEKGAVEIFNYRGKHQDEYTYYGQPRDKQDNEKHHDINV